MPFRSKRGRRGRRVSYPITQRKPPKIVGGKVVRGRKLAKLTPAEDKAWTQSFSFYMNNGYSEARADKHAWMDIQGDFPRLKGFDGALP